MLMQYLKYAKDRLQPLDSLLRFLFNLHFMLPDRFYKLSLTPDAKAVFKSIVAEFEELGLLYRSESGSRIAASPLLKLWQKEPSTVAASENDQFLIVESNFRYVAYTTSPFHRSILST